MGIGWRILGDVQTNELCLSVLVSDKIAIEGLPPEVVVPKQLGNVPTDVVHTGTIRANQVPTGIITTVEATVSVNYGRAR